VPPIVVAVRGDGCALLTEINMSITSRIIVSQQQSSILATNDCTNILAGSGMSRV